MSTNKATVNEVVLQGKIKDVFYKDNVTVLSKINYTLKKIDTEGGQDKFILVFYNKGKYDVLVDRYVDFKIYDDDYSLVHYRIFTQKKKFRLLIEELLGKSMY